jgi:hypothetical protein
VPFTIALEEVGIDVYPAQYRGQSILKQRYPFNLEHLLVESQAPPWSWLTVKRSIIFLSDRSGSRESPTDRSVHVAEILSIDIQLAGLDPLAQLSG